MIRPPRIRIPGVGSIPAGFVVGRRGGGTGSPQLIPMSDLVGQSSGGGAGATVIAGGITELTGDVTAGPGSGSQPAALVFGHGAQTAVAGAATLNQRSGVITSEALVAATTYTLTLTNSKVAATSTVIVNQTNSASLPVTLVSVTPGSGSVVIVVGMAALTGTVKIAFAVFN